MWLKPTLEAKKQNNFELVSLSDPALDDKATDKELFKCYLNGKFEAANEFIWSSDRTVFICRPLRLTEWQDIQLKVLYKTKSITIEENEFTSLYQQQAGLEVFRACFRAAQVGEEIFERKEIFASIPQNVQSELGQLVILGSNVLSPLS
jgi:hypothetical protein